MRWQGVLAVAVSALAGCGGSGGESGGKLPVSPKTLHLVDIATGLDQPMMYRACTANPRLAYVIERPGRIRLLVDDVLQATPALDISAQVSAVGEGGLLGMALDPDFATNRFIYLYYTVGGNPDSQVTRFTFTADFRSSSPNTARSIMRVSQPYSNHKGGALGFGRDKMLYWGLGDGGSGNDPEARAQNGADLHGKFLRIDPNGDDFPTDTVNNYHIPTNNPFVGRSGVRGEIWSVGWRNPFRWQFDSVTGGILAADVGQDAVEEFDYEPPASPGRNYGWRLREGNRDTGLGGAQFSSPLTEPFHTIDHPDAEAVVGGFIYRGSAIPGLRNRYLFADYITSRFWTLYCFFNPSGEMQHASPGMLTEVSMVSSLNGPVSIDPDRNGEPIISELNSGSVRRVVP